MEKDSKETIEKFIKFLKSKKVYRQYKEAFKSNAESIGRDTCMENMLLRLQKRDSLDEAISSGFSWTGTEEGFGFWNAIDTDWQRLHFKK